MRKRPLLRFTICLLPALLLFNILFYAWFAGRTRDTAEDEVVRKAYIVSRLLSGASARALDRGEISSLKRTIEESFKDPHIAAVAVFGNDDKVIVQTTVPRTYEHLSTFETPVMLGEKNVARLVTSFSLDLPDEKVIARLRLTASLQAGLFLLIAAFMVWLCWREKLAERKRRESGGEIVVSEETLAEWMAGAEMPAWFLEGGGQADPLSIAGASLEKAMQLLAGEAEQQRRTVESARQSLSRVESWRREALKGGGSAASLIATGREILASVEAGCRPPVGHARGLDESARVAVAVGRIIEELLAADVEAFIAPDERLRLAATLSREGIATIRERVFPALATAVKAGESVSARIAPLVEKVDGCGDRSSDLTRYGAELAELADCIRLMRRDLRSADESEGSEGEERLNRLAERVESLASSLKRETMDLLAITNDATAVARTMLSVLDEARDRLLFAGSAVEDAAAAAVMGADHLSRVLLQADGEDLHGGADNRGGARPAARQELQLHLAALQTAAGGAAGQADSGDTAEQVQSLSLVAENLLLAARFLAEIADGAAQLAGDGAGEGGAESAGADSAVAIRQLIVSARVRLDQARAISVPADEEAAGKS